MPKVPITLSDQLDEAVRLKLTSENRELKKANQKERSISSLIRGMLAAWIGRPELAELDTKLGRPRREDSE